MSSNHGRGCARESAERDRAFRYWLSGYDPGDGSGPVGEFDPDGMFTAECLRDAFLAGMTERLQVESVRGDDAALTVQTLRLRAKTPPAPFTDKDAERAANVVEAMWHELGEARRLVQDAASLFRMYGRHHRDQAETLRNKGPVEAVAFHDRIAKATRNEAMAARLDRWLKGDPENPAEVLRKISEGIAERTGLEVDHAAFDEAAARLDERVEVEDGGIERTVLTGWEYQGEDAHGRGVWHRPGEDGYVGTTITTDPDKAPDWLEPADGTTVVEDMEAAVVLTSRPFRPYGPDDCDFPICKNRFGPPTALDVAEVEDAIRGEEINWGSGERSFDSVTSEDAARRIADRDLERLRTFPPDPAERLINRERNFDWELYDRLTQTDQRSWLEKATDWVANLLDGRPGTGPRQDGPGYREGGFVKESVAGAMPDIRPAMKAALDRSIPVRVSPPQRLDTAGDTATFRLSTPDPRFDPAEPVLVNGYPYRPATKD